MTACESKQQRAAEAAAQGQALFSNGQYPAALHQLQIAAGLQDDLPGLWLLIGKTYAAMQDLPSAYSAYKNALDQDQTSREALFALAQISLRARQYPDASDYASRILTLDPGNADARSIAAYAALGNGQLRDAEDIARTLLKDNAENEPGLVVLSMLATREGRLQDAENLLAPLLKDGTATSASWRQLRRIYRREGNVRAFLTATDKLLASAPGETPFNLDRAEALYLLGQAAPATAVLATLAGKTSGTSLRDDIIALWFRGGVPPSTVADTLGPSAPPMLVTAAARYAVRAGAPAVALAVASRASGTALSDQLERQGIISLAHVLMANPAGGQEADKVLAADGKQPEALRAQVEVSLRSGAIEHALTQATVLLADNPALATAYDLMARVYTRQGNTLLADNTVANGINALPKNVDALILAANYWRSRGDKERAQSLAEAYTRRLPLSRAAWQERQHACTESNDLKCLNLTREMLSRLAGNAPTGGKFIAVEDADAEVAAGLFEE